ncbi:hypothetical protein HDE_02847 [Halotydeus destructor]|nr:hypothetical protein HDE_02847 [Halotydeus destructor]
MGLRLVLTVLAIVYLGINGETPYDQLQCEFYSPAGFKYCNYNVTYVTIDHLAYAFGLTSQPLVIVDPTCYQVAYKAPNAASNFTVSSVNTITGKTTVLYQDLNVPPSEAISNATLLPSADPVQILVEQYPILLAIFSSVSNFTC